MGWLEGDVALITGAGSGLGKALVERFVAEGARVVAVDRDEARAAAMEEAHERSVLGVAADVTDPSANEAAVGAAVNRFGKLDVFVGNAGIYDFGAGVVATPIDKLESSFDELFAVNVKAPLLGVKAAADELLKTEGCVLLTASIGSWHAGVGGAVYTASKHAVVGLVRQLALELAPRVRVNGVAPGLMSTDIRGPKALGLQDTTPSAIPEFDLEQIAQSKTPLAFLPSPADYTGHFVQLASRQNAPATTGTVVDCDGGIGVRGLGL